MESELCAIATKYASNMRGRESLIQLFVGEVTYFRASVTGAGKHHGTNAFYFGNSTSYIPSLHWAPLEFGGDLHIGWQVLPLKSLLMLPITFGLEREELLAKINKEQQTANQMKIQHQLEMADVTAKVIF